MWIGFEAFPYLLSILYFSILYFHFQKFKGKRPKPYQGSFFPKPLEKMSQGLLRFIRSGGNGISLRSEKLYLSSFLLFVETLYCLTSHLVPTEYVRPRHWSPSRRLCGRKGGGPSTITLR